MSPLTAVPALNPTHLPDSASSHALAVRLPAGTDADAMAEALAKAVRLWWPDVVDRLPRLWIDEVAARASAQAARRRLEAELHRPATGKFGPLFRAVLLRYADGLADLVLVAHRTVLDAPSLRLIADVLTRGKDPSELRAAAPAMSSLPSDDAAFEDWRTADFGGRIDWAAPDPGVTHGTGVVELVLPAAPEDAAASLAVAGGVVLGRYEGGHKPAVGLLVNRADRPAQVLGAYDAETLLALDVSGALPVGELVTTARRALAEGPWCERHAYRELCTISGGRVLLGLLLDGADDGGRLACQSPPFPLTVVLTPRANCGLSMGLHYRLRDVSPEAARAFARHLVSVFEQLCTAEAELHPGGAELLNKAEKERQIALGRPSVALDWQPRRIDAAFKECAAGRSEATALRCGGQSLTYQELDKRSDQYAAALRSLAVRPGERVGICLDRSVDLVVSMLAVLKADAVYVPMDPAYPGERLDYMIKDADLRIVITDLEVLPAAARPVSPAQLAQATGDTGRPAPGNPEDAAYVIYTSGSSGRPKGVLVPHRNVVALISATRDDFGLGPQDTWTLFHSPAFDFSVWEIWGPLLTGATLVVVPYWISRSPDEFCELLARERVTVLNQTPTAFAQLMEAERRQSGELSARLVIFGGEPLDARMLLPWLDRHPESRCRLVNMFGITETTVHVTAQSITRREALAGSRSVGTALPGWHVRVLDEVGRPVPCGVAGEIYVGGEGVALGYLGRPELTAERFVNDPATGERLYRSGDQGRLRPDGRLEHLGRLDSQVKVRGFRIELDEIRNVLLDDHTVASAAVLLGGDAAHGAAGVRIDAYVVLEPGGEVAAVRHRSAKLLPEFMVPATVTSLSALPLTANGKLDARSLPEPLAPSSTTAIPPEPAAGAPQSATASQEAKTNSLGAELVEVWESVLGLPVGLDDSFFDLGGNSLYAVRIAAAMRERSLPALSLRQLYLTPTLRTLVELLEWQGANGEPSTS
ncbi:amino acid adenylation domain-containing protein [Streptomyces sp. NPDC090306]|uniref:non-ribosomal peptide synthetase n=1 Tax=Streptomyces sp. NPDC090306 TaxID=3365961 RepID=UPI003818F532